MNQLFDLYYRRDSAWKHSSGLLSERMSSAPLYVALYSYVATSDDELTVRRGQKVYALEFADHSGDTNWWKVHHAGVVLFATSVTPYLLCFRFLVGVSTSESKAGRLRAGHVPGQGAPGTGCDWKHP